MMKLRDYVLHSGGAAGADSCWDSVGRPLGVKCFHYYPEGHPTPIGNTPISLPQLRIADTELHTTNLHFLKRKFPPSSTIVANLIRRNYWQVKDAEAVYAISAFNSAGVVQGGTAWAVYMGILKNIPVYVFDQDQNEWFVYHNNWDTWHTWDVCWKPCVVPALPLSFAGVGTRELREVGEQAIIEVYQKTLELRSC